LLLVAALYLAFTLSRRIDFFAPKRPLLVALPDEAGDPPPTLFTGVRVFDGTDDVLSPPLDVLVSRGKIAALGGPTTIAAPPGTLRVNGQGQTLLPGLFESHIHMGGSERPPWAAAFPDPRSDAAALLYAGVTTAIEAAKNDFWDSVVSGEWLGPRVFRPTTLVTAKGGHPVPLFKELIPWPVDEYFIWRIAKQTRTAENARRIVKSEIKENRLDYIKVIYDSLPPDAPHLSPEALAAIVEEARAHGQPVFVHVGTPEDALEAAEAGAALLMHVPFKGVLSHEQTRRLARSGIPIVTTLRLHSVYYRGFNGNMTFSPLELGMIRPGAAEAIADMPEDFELCAFPRELVEKLPQFASDASENIRKLHTAGVPLLAGSDSGGPGMVPGAALHEELSALVDAGVPPAHVLRMATSAPARFLYPNLDLGVIRVGARADLLLVEGNPIADIRNVSRIAGVWQNGRRLQRGPR
jgi:imidazolonepropionase-like amidohydrolase